MNTINPRLLRSLHRVIELAEEWRPTFASGADAGPLHMFNKVIEDSKEAMKQVHVQQAYIKKQTDATVPSSDCNQTVAPRK